MRMEKGGEREETQGKVEGALAYYTGVCEHNVLLTQSEGGKVAMCAQCTPFVSVSNLFNTYVQLPTIGSYFNNKSDWNTAWFRSTA